MPQYQLGVPEEQQIQGAGVKTVLLTNNTTATPIKTIQIANGETGYIFLRYSGTQSQGRSAKRWKIIDFDKTLAGALTIHPESVIYNRNATGMANVNITAVNVGGNIELRVVGLSNTEVLHVLQSEITSEVFD